MVTTNDSRIRFINLKVKFSLFSSIQNGKIFYKIKGHKNENYPVYASMSEDKDHVICGSEDGDLYMWSQISSTVVQMSKKGVFGKLLTTNKSSSCEYFSPFGKAIPLTGAIFAPGCVIKRHM